MTLASVLDDAAAQGESAERAALLDFIAAAQDGLGAQDGLASLCAAVARGRAGTARLLIAAGVDPPAADAGLTRANSPLHAAAALAEPAEAGHCVELLLGASFDPNAVAEGALRPLHAAATVEVARALLRGGAAGAEEAAAHHAARGRGDIAHVLRHPPQLPRGVARQKVKLTP